MDQSVLCVLVLYNRQLDQAAAWSCLIEELRRADAFAALRLDHILVYDNSPVKEWGDVTPRPGLSLVHDPANGGTIAAYRAAVDVANDRGCDRILLLDQDTALPSNYLEHLSQADLTADVIVPQVHNAGQLVSPAWCSEWGSMTPIADLSRRDSGGFITAISSGTLLRQPVLTGAEPFPKGMWLDYVDHWIFLSLDRANGRVALADIVIDHDLSVMNPATLSPQRIDSILNGESALLGRLSKKSHALLPLRRLMRAMKLMRVNPTAAHRIFRRTFSPSQEISRICPQKDGRSL